MLSEIALGMTIADLGPQRDKYSTQDGVLRRYLSNAGANLVLGQERVPSIFL